MLSRLRGRLRTSEKGFSLAEMLVVIAILGVVSVPVANVAMGMLRNTSDSSRRLAESHDAQLSAVYWAQDVANVGTRSTTDPLDPQLLTSVETNKAASAGLYQCGNDAAIVRMASDNVVVSGGNATTTLVIVAYVVKPAGGSRFELHRVRCVGGAVVSNLTVAKSLLSTPQAVCDGTSVCDGSGSNVPKTMDLPLRIQGASSNSSYDVTLSGQRRQE
jgi:prepilin-type N-terminal cleavage/methylation domain-containing protein